MNFDIFSVTGMKAYYAASLSYPRDSEAVSKITRSVLNFFKNFSLTRIAKNPWTYVVLGGTALVVCLYKTYKLKEEVKELEEITSKTLNQCADLVVENEERKSELAHLLKENQIATEYLTPAIQEINNDETNSMQSLVDRHREEVAKTEKKLEESFQVNLHVLAMLEKQSHRLAQLERASREQVHGVINILSLTGSNRIVGFNPVSTTDWEKLFPMLQELVRELIPLQRKSPLAIELPLPKTEGKEPQTK